MAEDLFVEAGEDGNLWITSCRFGTVVAVCRRLVMNGSQPKTIAFAGKSDFSHL